jgi:hypothetical protein
VAAGSREREGEVGRQLDGRVVTDVGKHQCYG